MATKETQYIEAVGRRKTSVARARLFEASKQSFTINDKELAVYFPTKDLQNIAVESLQSANLTQKYKVTIKTSGGGMNSQAESVRHAVARALLLVDANLRKDLKKAGYLKRDPRAKERRKFGLKKARKAPQWSKR